MESVAGSEKHPSEQVGTQATARPQLPRATRVAARTLAQSSRNALRIVRRPAQQLKIADSHPRFSPPALLANGSPHPSSEAVRVGLPLPWGTSPATYHRIPTGSCVTAGPRCLLMLSSSALFKRRLLPSLAMATKFPSPSSTSKIRSMATTMAATQEYPTANIKQAQQPAPTRHITTTCANTRCLSSPSPKLTTCEVTVISTPRTLRRRADTSVPTALLPRPSSPTRFRRKDVSEPAGFS